ncbi:neogenin-like isoform X3 [Mytilus californianus]|uniref:neogenin-like isoform X3 n=1 Tax=Mytilus californianus TaxID=6549 RepID=UPI002246AF2E|nr:neogenin-like isoform X3 [Mytilus californianus]
MLNCKMRETFYVTFSLFVILDFLQQLYAVDVPKFTDFYFSVEPTNVIAIRDQTAQFDCAVFVGDLTANGEITPTIEWIKDGQKLNLQDDNRRLIQKNGSLLISPVHSGGTDMGFYQCKATVPELGTLVSRKAYLHIAHLSKTFRTEPEDLSVYLYDAAMFGCVIDGVPKPNISWYKDRIPLQEKKNVRVHLDGVLEIYPVQFNDFGSYHCLAENVDKKMSSRMAKLEQNANVEVILNGLPPSFVYKPEDTHAEAGSTVTLFCGANGRDTQQKEPSITWLKDGNAIDFKQAQGRLEIVGRGSLKIYSANEADSGTYTCRAENLLDSDDSDASLIVLVPPKFNQQPLNRIAHENSDIEFKCDINGSPQPEVVWMKDGVMLKPSDYFHIIDKKHLRILGLLESDAGMYQCFGNNSVGNVQASVQLMVVNQNVPLPTTTRNYRLPTYLGGNIGNEINLPSEPKDLQAVIVSKQFVTLKWNDPEKTGPLNEGSLVYSVFWKEKESQRERVLNTTLNEANIQHLKPDTSYEFRIRTYNNNGPSPSFARLSITTERDIDVPTPPTNVHADAKSPESIRVSWDPPAQAKGKITKYKLMYYMKGDAQEHRIEIIKTNHILQGLKTFKEYSISVVAFNENGEGGRSDEIEARTLSDRPSDIPQNVTLEAASATSLILRWEPPPEETRNGIITGYKIRFKKRTDMRSRTVTTDGNRRLYALVNLEKNTQYQVKIAPINVNGTGPYTNKLKATTFRDDLDESVVPTTPRKLRVTSYATSIRVSWTAPEPESKIMVRGYTLGYGKGIADVYMEVLGPDVNVFTIESLEPNAEYVITVRAYNKKGDGPPKYQTAKTSEAEVVEHLTPMMPPVGLKTIVLSSSTVLLTWTDTSLGSSQRNTDNRFYTVRYTPLQGSGRRNRDVNSTGLNCHIDNLKPYTKYEFSVKVIKGRRQSTWSMSVLNTTEEAAPGSAPRDLTTISIEKNPKAVRLNWQPPVTPNGQITGYLIFYTTDPNLEDVDWVVEGVLPGERLTTTIKGLTPDTTYYFKMQTRNSKGYGPISPTVIYKTPKSDGTGGGKINPEYPPDFDTQFNPKDFPAKDYFPPVQPEGQEPNKADEGKDKVGGLSTNIIIIIIASVVGAVFCVVIIVVAIVFCRRRDYGERGKRPPQGTQSPSKKPGQKELKPPDLWIHHDPMELKSLNKPDRSDSMLTMSTLRRNSQDSKSIDDNLPPYRPDIDKSNSDVYYCGEDSFPRRSQGMMRSKPSKLSISVDTQGPPRELAMVTALPNGMSQDNQSQGHPRPGFPRTQYNMQYSSTPRVNAGDMPQPSSMPILNTDYHYKLCTLDEDDFSSANDTMEDCYPARVGYARSTEALSITGRSQPTAIVTPDKRINDGHKSLPRHCEVHKSLPRNMHPMRSFSVPTPPPLGHKHGGLTPKHQIVKPQQSPYKKTTPISSVPIKPRTMTVISTPPPPKAPDIILKTGKEPEGELQQKSASTEELTAEMENLDCLMKDLNAITQQDFQC